MGGGQTNSVDGTYGGLTLWVGGGGEGGVSHFFARDCTSHGGHCSAVLDPNPRGVGGGEKLSEGGGGVRKFYCLRQVHLAENLPQATHTQNRVKTT